MPIPRNRLDPILVVDETATVRQVVGTLLSGEPYNQWYTVVTRRKAGGFGAFTLVQLNDDAERLGAAVLDAPLKNLSLEQAATVERTETNPNQAERDARRAPGQRLLVLENGEPVGVVALKSRGGAHKAVVIELYQEQVGPEPEDLAQMWSLLSRNFLLLRPQITLAEADWALACADVKFAVVPLPENHYALLERRDLEFELSRLGHHTLDQIYAVRQRTGERLLSEPLPGVDVSRARPRRSEDVIVLRDGRPIGFFLNPKRYAKAEEPAPLAADGGGERYVNAWFEGHDASQPLARGTRYDLGINVGTQRADSYVVGETYRGPVDQDVYVGLVGDPDSWRIDGPAVKKLHVPAEGDSEPVLFQVTPLKQGQRQLVAHFYYRNHLLQTVEITGIQVVISEEAGADTPKGQKPIAVTLTRAAAGMTTSDRDANLYIEWLPDQDRFRFTFFSAPSDADGQPVLHNARVPLSADEMTVMADAARDTIETHLIQYKEGNNQPFLFVSKDKSQQPSDAAFQKAIFELAQLGYRWFIRLFYSQKEPTLAAEAQAMGDLLLQASASERLRLQVVSSDFYLPWNLFYTPPSGQREPLTGETVTVEGIWGFRHVIEQVPARDLSHVRGGPVIDAADGLKMSASINLTVDGGKLKPASDQVKYFEGKAKKSELKLELATRFSEPEVLQAFQDAANAEEIVYFYCHAVTKGDPKTRFQESRLILTEEARALKLDELITATFGLPPLPKAPLVFLNACGSAEMDAQFYDSFVQFMRDRGARTVIGTLNNTPTVVGAVFAMSFFEQFLLGGPERSAAQLLFDLRHQFLDAYRNPVGLSYALFYNGDTFVKRET